MNQGQAARSTSRHETRPDGPTRPEPGSTRQKKGENQVSTSATIAVTGPDGSGEAVRLLQDGYPEQAGVKLLLQYDHPPDARTLVSLAACPRNIDTKVLG